MMHDVFGRGTAAGLAALWLIVFLADPLPASQQKVDPQSYQYRKDYAAVEKIMEEQDPAARAEMLLGFVKERPDSGMMEYVKAYYGQIVAEHQKTGDWSKVVAMNEALLALIPEDEATRKGLMAAQYQSGNLAKAAEMGEKIYAKNPDKALAADMANLYLQLKNTDRYMIYAQKILDAFPMEQAYGTALQMSDIHLQKQEIDQASALMAKVMETFAGRIPPGFQESDWNKRRALAYGLQAAQAYRAKDYPKAIQLYTQVAEYAPQAEEPYYYIGMSLWQTKDPEGAMPYFAKASVLGKNLSQKAQQYLEQLYKARNQDSLDGLDQLLAKARQELGVGG